MIRSVIIILFLWIAVLGDTAWGGIVPFNAADLSSNDQLDRLNHAMEESSRYESMRKQRIDSLCRILKNVPESNAARRWEINMTIGNQLRAILADSAIRYYTASERYSKQTGDSAKILLTRIELIGALSRAGIFNLAENQFNEVRRSPLPDSLRNALLKAGRQLYSYMINYSRGNKTAQNHYRELFTAIDDELLRSLPKSDPTYRFYHAERLVSTGDYARARVELEKIMEETPEESNMYGMAAYQLAQVLKHQGDTDGYLALLAMAARSDIMSGAKEGFAMPELASELYARGRFNEAYRYINHALQDAMMGNARMSAVGIASSVPLIDEAYRRQIDRSHTVLIILLILTGLLLVTSVILFIDARRKHRRAESYSIRLSEAAKLKDSYIANFLELSSIYADKMEQLSKMISRKIAAGQTAELAKMLESGRFSDTQNEDLFRVFDSAFLAIYPHFIVEINKLLRDDQQIELATDSKLTPELRIYAFVYLGINESTRIARILHYSVSTIYAYRNRMRNRAIDRDNFEENVMKIGSFHAI